MGSRLYRASLVLLLAAAPGRAAPVPPAPAVTPQSAITDFLAAREANDRKRVVAAYDRLLNARLDANLRGPMPELDLMESLLALRQAASATRILLERAAQTAFPQQQLALVTLGRLQEAQGDLAAARASYASARAMPGDAALRREATFAMARLALGTSAADALALVEPELAQLKAPGDRFDGDLTRSRALAVEGKAAAAQDALAQASAEATASDDPATAVIRAAHDLALEAPDRRRALRLVAVGGSPHGLFGTVALPHCDATLHPDDWVTLEAFKSHDVVLASLVRASRDGIGDRFIAPLARSPAGLAVPASGVTLRCRNGIDTSLPASPALDPLGAWAGAHGYYVFGVAGATAGDAEADLQAWLATYSAKLGEDAPQLVPSLYALAAIQTAEAVSSENTGYFQLAREALDRALRIALAAKAPADLTMALRWQRDALPGANPATPRTPLALFDEAAANPAISPAALGAILDQLARQGGKDSGRPLLDHAAAVFATRKLPPDDPILRWLALQRIGKRQADGDVAAIRDIARAARLPLDGCQVQSKTPSPPPEFTAIEYPTDLLPLRVQGLTESESDVAADGRTSAARLLVSSPPGLFDAPAQEPFRSHTLVPAEQPLGRATACRGYALRFRWQVPADDDAPAN